MGEHVYKGEHVYMGEHVYIQQLSRRESWCKQDLDDYY
jgi:hypothetical protein